MKRSEYKKLLLEFLQLNELPEPMPKTKSKKTAASPKTTQGSESESDSADTDQTETEDAAAPSQEDLKRQEDLKQHKGLYNVKGVVTYNQNNQNIIIPHESFEIKEYGIMFYANTNGEGYGEFIDNNNSEDSNITINNYLKLAKDPETVKVEKSSRSSSDLSGKGKENVKAIQRIIDPDETHTEPDGDWKSGTNRAWYEYIRDNYKIINQMIKDNKGPKASTNESRLMMLFEQDGSSDYLTGEEEDGDSKMNAAQLAQETGNPGNIAGVLDFTQGVEQKRKNAQGSEAAAANVSDEKKSIPEVYWGKYCKTENDIVYYVSGEGTELWENNTNPGGSTPDLFKERSTTSVKVWNDAVKLIKNDKTKMISKADAINLTPDYQKTQSDSDSTKKKDTVADNKTASAGVEKDFITRLAEYEVDIQQILIGTRRGRSRSGSKMTQPEAQALVKPLFELFMNYKNNGNTVPVFKALDVLKEKLQKMSESEQQEKLINSYIRKLERKGRRKSRKAKRVGRRQGRKFISNLEESKQITGVNQMKKRSLMSLVESYLNEQVPDRDNKTEGGGSLTGWDAYSDKGADHKKVAEAWKKYCNQDKYKGDDQIFPGNHSASLQGFGRWYNACKKSEEAMGLIGKKKGQEFSPKEAAELLDKLAAQLEGEKGADAQSAISAKPSLKGIVQNLKRQIPKMGLDANVVNPFLDSLDLEKDKEEIQKLKGLVVKKDVDAIKKHINDLAGKESLKEGLSRGSLYRRRYYGRY